jgi:hypothetical protein
MKKPCAIALTITLLLIAGAGLKAQTPVVNTSINNVITAYFDVKNALAANNGVVAESNAKILKAQIEAVPVKDMGADRQTVWKNYVDKLDFDSRHISESTSIDHQREHFASLSKNMYTVVKSFKVNSTPIYWQYCPMKKASWLSEKPGIENPYYGKEMPNCGSTKETLKAVK